MREFCALECVESVLAKTSRYQSPLVVVSDVNSLEQKKKMGAVSAGDSGQSRKGATAAIGFFEQIQRERW